MSDKTIQYRIEISEYDLQVAKSLFDKNHYLCVLRRQIDTDIEPLPFSRGVYFSNDAAKFVNQIVRKGKVIYKEGRT